MRKPLTHVCCLAILTLVSAAAVAQPAGRPDSPRRGGGPGGISPALIRFLELTDEQRATLQGLQEELRNTVQPLAQEVRDLQTQLRDHLQSDSPDALTVGELILASRAIEGQIQAAGRDFQDDFVALLSDEQQVRYGAYQAALRTLRGAQGRGRDGAGQPRP